MTWRERLVEGRKRGYLTEADQQALGNVDAPCMVKEACESVGLSYISAVQGKTRDPLLESIAYSWTLTFWAAEMNDFDTLDRLLDAVEDRVLQLKREWSA